MSQASWATSLAREFPESLLSPPPSCQRSTGIPDVCYSALCGFWGLNSCPRACKASALPPEPSPQLAGPSFWSPLLYLGLQGPNTDAVALLCLLPAQPSSWYTASQQSPHTLHSKPSHPTTLTGSSGRGKLLLGLWSNPPTTTSLTVPAL